MESRTGGSRGKNPPHFYADLFGDRARSPDFFIPKRREKKTMAVTIKKLLALGEKYKVHQEEDFIQAARTYVEEARLIEQMRKQLKADGLTVTKEYVKGRENLTAHPLIAEIPKHVDCANRTLMNMASIIEARGTMPDKAEEDDLTQFRLNA